MSFSSLLAAALMTLSQPVPVDVPLSIPQGPILGRAVDGVQAFKAIPYAAPPVGPLRWRPPAAAPTWIQTRDAGSVGAICVQPPANGDNGVGPLPMSEDCLTLNVWAPQARKKALPVMVWIHGGGYINGSGTAALYDGTRLARQDVVVVTINYRLGRLGFFDHPALAAERSPDEAGGNYGVMDMIAALKWVQANIAAFGGDPAQVTIFGESAGGVAVTQLMVSPPARGLFHRAIVQSGLGRQRGLTPVEAQARGAAWGEAKGVEPTAQALRALPATDLLSPAPDFIADLVLRDGLIVPEDIVSAFAAGHQAAVPLIVGTNSAELWWQRIALEPEGKALDPVQRTAAELVYGGVDVFDHEGMSDLVFNEPARYLARLHAAAGHPAWLYRFDVVSLAMPEPHAGATHASDRQYVFDTLDASPWPTDGMDRQAAQTLSGYWTRFARTGTPNASGHRAWPRVRRADTSGDTPVMLFTNSGPLATTLTDTARLDAVMPYGEMVPVPPLSAP